MTTPAPTAPPTHWGGFQLDPFQRDAIGALAQGRSVLVCAPTGTGKTVIADWIVDEALRTGRQVVYTAPVKALSNQKYRGWVARYGEDKVGLVTGDLVIRRDAPCLVMTTEILRNMLLTDDAPRDLLAVVLDEIHFLDDRERGTVWEEVLIYLPRTVRVVGLSATLSNVSDFGAWLSAVRGERVAVVVEEKRAVPLELLYCARETGLVAPDGFAKRLAARRSTRQRGRGRARSTSHVDVIAAIEDADLLPCLYFSFSRRDCEGHARRLIERKNASFLRPDQVDAVDDALLDPDVSAVLDLGLASALRDGVAWHHAGLHVRLKQLVETLYEKRLIAVLFCTSTFALGVNLPARTVAFDGLFKFDGRSTVPLTTRQFLQKAGRAGRRGLDDVGHVVVRIDADEWERVAPVLDRLRQARPEPVRSGFNLSFSSVARLLQRHGVERARDVVNKSYLAWHLARKANADWAAAEQSTRPKDARKLSQRAAEANDRVWRDFEAKVHFLRDVGYLGADLDFQAGANALLHLQINEVLVAELFLQGVLEELGPETLFGLCCALVADLPRNATSRVKPDEVERRLAGHVRAIAGTPVVEEAARLTDTPVVFDPSLIPFGRAWANGRPLAELMEAIECETDVSGDLVNAFRRAKDLAGQLANVWAHDANRAAAVRALVKRVDRDEVEVIA